MREEIGAKIDAMFDAGITPEQIEERLANDSALQAAPLNQDAWKQAYA